MPADAPLPRIRQIVLDTTDPRGLAEFYRQVFGLAYRAGDEPPAPGQPDPNGDDWLVLRSGDGGGGSEGADAVSVAFQKTDELKPSTWPDGTVPQQLHLDTTVPTADDLRATHERVLGLGARLVLDRFDDPDEPLYVYADPSGPPFCIFVGGAGPSPALRAGVS